MDRDETGCQAPPDRPILCINNCGFFGSAATMIMCSKCHKDLLLKSEQSKVATSAASHITKLPIAGPVDVHVSNVEPTSITVQPSCETGSKERVEAKPEVGPERCDTCKKRVGLTGFKCQCGNLYCAAHRYSDKHDCEFDYRNAAWEAIAKANPVVKAEKLDKI